MRTIVTIVLIAAAASIVIGQEERPVPNDSARISIPGCARDRIFTVGQPVSRPDANASGIQSGRRFRLSGPRALLDEIRRIETRMVEITGLVRKADLSGPGGITAMGGRIRIGGAPTRDPVRDPMFNQVVIDVEAFQELPDRCGER